MNEAGNRPLIRPKAYLGGPKTQGYNPPNDVWMELDGTSPPLFPAIRLVDQNTGAVYILTSESGVLTLTAE